MFDQDWEIILVREDSTAGLTTRSGYPTPSG
jgi:hypothetical protein